MNTSWVPLGEDAAAYSALHEGIPPWLEGPLWSWIGAVVHFEMRYTDNRCELVLGRMDMALRLPHPITRAAFSGHGLEAVKLGNDSAVIVKMVDFLIMDNIAEGNPADNEWLEDLLHDSGSVWKVGQRNGVQGLERRVPLGVQVAADAIMTSGGSAGELLSQAWHAAFGQKPDPEKAYKKAIVAVEEAAASKVLPNNRRATLGTIVAAMRDQATWSLPLVEDRQPTKGTVLMMCQALWAGETGRHGGNGYRPSTREEAESAVLLAVPLVHLFLNDLVTRGS